MYRWAVVSLIPILMAFTVRLMVPAASPIYLGQRDLELQSAQSTCGPAALAYVLRHHGLTVTEEELATLAGTTDTGTTMLGLKQAAEYYGLRAHGIKGGFQVLSKIPLPAIAVFKDHFVVITSVGVDEVEVGDPMIGFLRYNRRAFLREWQGQILVIER